MVWFIASSFTSTSCKQYKLSKPSGPSLDKESCGSVSYHLVKDNDIKLPNTDVFIELAQF